MIRRTGSVKQGIVAPDLLEERAKCAFDQQELQTLMYGGEERLTAFKSLVDTWGADEGIRNRIECYDYTPHEMQEELWKRINVLYKKHKHRVFETPMI